jgi:hypothetical protein
MLLGELKSADALIASSTIFFRQVDLPTIVSPSSVVIPMKDSYVRLHLNNKLLLVGLPHVRD